MGDVAGCRCILRTDAAVKKVIDLIQYEFDVINENDYLEIPKEDGYRGYHVYIKSPINDKRSIEIQVRSNENHNWATLVEIIDVIFNLKIKEGQIIEDLNYFLKLLSRKETLTIQEKIDVIRIDKNRNIYSKLNEIFIKNYIPIRRKWLDVSSEDIYPYYIIEVDQNKTSHISSFPNYKLAEKHYYQKFTNNTKSNFVLTHVNKATFKKLCVAYSNYILVKHSYLNDWNKLVFDLIEHNFKKGNKKEFQYYYDYVERNFNDINKEIGNDLKEVRLIIDSAAKNEELFPYYGLDEWLSELEHMNNSRTELIKKIESMGEELPKSFWDKLRGG